MDKDPKPDTTQLGPSCRTLPRISRTCENGLRWPQSRHADRRPAPGITTGTGGFSDDTVYDEVTGERRLATENLAEYAAKSGVRDAPDNLLADGDAVVPIKELKDMAAGQPLKQAAVIRSIRLIDNLEEIDAGMM